MDKMKQILNLLQGKKTYLATIALGTLGLLWSEGLVSDETAKVLGTVLASMAGLALRAGINNAAKKGPGKK